VLSADPRRGGQIPSDLRQQNRSLILRQIATGQGASRAGLARATGLTKTTLGKIVAELIEQDLVYEQIVQPSAGGQPGRRPVRLEIGPRSPGLVGLLLRRGVNTGIIADLSGRILARQEQLTGDHLTGDILIDQLLTLVDNLRQACPRRLLAIGIASIGPVDQTGGRLVNPPNYHGIHDLPLVAAISARTGLPAWLIQDADAGALAEKLYGAGQELAHFLYVHIMNGIGAGYILQHQLFAGDSGRGGEIGHTSICFDGPVCACGGRGCLEVYANLSRMNAALAGLRGDGPALSWAQIIASDAADVTAVRAEFCGYVEQALANAISLLDARQIFIGYDGAATGLTIEQMLTERLNRRLFLTHSGPIAVRRSSFGGDAPLVGAVAFVADRVFRGLLKTPGQG
jgi:predicted NBD/HSP70 family sugar kinase